MHIGFDISSLPYRTGVSRYTSNLVQAIVGEYDQDNYTLFGSSLRQGKVFSDFAHELENSPERRFFPIPPKVQSIIFNKLHLPIEMFTGKLDIFHSWDWYTPGTKKSKLITTIHDLSAIKYPQYTHPDIVRHHRQSLAWIKKEAAVIIAVSFATKKDIVEILNIPENKVHVIYEALPNENKIAVTKKDVQDVAEKFSITKPYFLTVSSQEPRKNVRRSIEAWKSFAKDYQLVVVGRSGYAPQPSQAGVIQTGQINDHELAAIYQGASCLLYPSISEGFGLPVLEAFYHQIPVITSNTSSLPEIAGKAAALVNPLEVGSITEGIKEALDHKQKYIKAGTQQLLQFNWQKAAKQTHDVYQSVL